MVDKMTIIVTDKLAVAIAADVVVVFLLGITFRHNLSIIGSPRCNSGDTFHGHHKTMHIPFAQFRLLGCADTVRVGLENDADDRPACTALRVEHRSGLGSCYLHTAVRIDSA